MFAGLLIGQLAEIPIAGMAKSVLFMLFLFGIGYSVGPQFMQSLKRDGLKPMLLAVVVGLTGLAAATVVAKVLGLDPGLRGRAALGRTDRKPGDRHRHRSDQPSAASRSAAPTLRLPHRRGGRRLLPVRRHHRDPVLHRGRAAAAAGRPRAEALELERNYGIERSKAGLFSAWRKFELRAYRLRAGLAGHRFARVGSGGSALPDQRLFVQRIRRGDDIIEAEPSLVLLAGDVVAVSGPRETLVRLLGDGPQEVEDQLLLDVPVATVQVLVTNRELAGRTLAELAQGEWTRSLYLRAITRGGANIPLAPGITVERGDILHLVGPETVVERPRRASAPSSRRRPRPISSHSGSPSSSAGSWACWSPCRSAICASR